MPKTFNKELNKDVTELIRGKNSIGYHKKFEAVMEKHGISRTTLYKELSKETPGECSTADFRGRAVPITTDETAKVRRLIFKGKSTEEICLAMTAEMEFSYSSARLNKAKTKIIWETNPESTEGIDIEQAELNVRKFLYMLSGLDTSNPNRLITLSLGGLKHKFPVLVIKELLDILAISAADPAGGTKDLNSIAKFTLQRELLRRMRFVRNYSQVDLNRLERMRRKVLEAKPKETEAGSTESIDEQPEFTVSDIAKAVKYFSPLTGNSDIEAFIKKYRSAKTGKNESYEAVRCEQAPVQCVQAQSDDCENQNTANAE